MNQPKSAQTEVRVEVARSPEGRTVAPTSKAPAVPDSWIESVIGGFNEIPRDQHTRTEAALILFAIALRESRDALRLCKHSMRRPDESHNDCFERVAAEFYTETGLLAPGKSEPLEMHSVDRDDERIRRYSQWSHARTQGLWDAILRGLGETVPTSADSQRSEDEAAPEPEVP